MKIDPSFVEGLGRDPEDDPVVTAIVALAHALGMRAIAEGVETAAQLERLKELDCDFAQGFYLMEPTTPARLKALFAESLAVQ